MHHLITSTMVLMASTSKGGVPKYMGLSGTPLAYAVSIILTFGFVLVGYDQGKLSLLHTFFILPTYQPSRRHVGRHLDDAVAGHAPSS